MGCQPLNLLELGLILEWNRSAECWDTTAFTTGSSPVPWGSVSWLFVNLTVPGQRPEWVTFTPDSRFVDVAAAGDNQTVVIDTSTLTDVARILVRQVSKRIGTATLQAF